MPLPQKCVDFARIKQKKCDFEQLFNKKGVYNKKSTQTELGQAPKATVMESNCLNAADTLAL